MLGQAFEGVLAAARTGAGWACTSLYEDLAGPVTGYLARQGAAEPDDLASETFLRVFGALDRFEGDEQGFRAWVFTIAHHRLLDERRRLGRRPVTVELADAVEPTTRDDVTPDAALEAVVTANLVRRLEVLTDDQREVVLLRVLADLPVEHVAAVTGRSPDAVRQLQRRALRRLAASLTSN